MSAEDNTSLLCCFMSIRIRISFTVHDLCHQIGLRNGFKYEHKSNEIVRTQLLFFILIILNKDVRLLDMRNDCSVFINVV